MWIYAGLYRLVIASCTIKSAPPDFLNFIITNLTSVNLVEQTQMLVMVLEKATLTITQQPQRNSSTA